MDPGKLRAHERLVKSIYEFHDSSDEEPQRYEKSQPQLQTQKHEKFCQRRHAGKTTSRYKSLVPQSVSYQVYLENADENLRNSIKNSLKQQSSFNFAKAWSETPEVKKSGVLTKLTDRQIKKQEAIFEILTSEASYVRSLMIFEDTYLKLFSQLCQSETSGNYDILAKYITPFIEPSKKFERDMCEIWLNDIMLTSIFEVFEAHINQNFELYKIYAGKYKEIVLSYEELCKTKKEFKTKMINLSKSPEAQMLTMEFFTIMPIQRIMRYPKLVEGVLKYTEKGDPLDFSLTDFSEDLQQVRKLLLPFIHIALSAI